MKRFFKLSTTVGLWGLVSLFLFANKSYAQALAFPGAVGFGKNVTGGRGGTVYHVTNLNDAGPGSFRDAVSASNRIVVFDVSGYITLKTAVSAKSNLTIAGQTAPGEGIGFRGGKISFGKQSNIIIRYIRVRPGSEVASTGDVGINLYDARDVIVDHCSIEFAPWNNIGGVTDDWTKYPVTNVTFQNCLIADPTYQQFGAHIESPNSDWTWAYNIFANSHNRNPLDKVNDIFVNNILYNVSAGYTTHTSTNFKHDIINNYFVMGPASTGTDNQWYQVDKNQTIYYTGNMKDSNLDGVLNGSGTTPKWYQGPGTILSAPWSAETKYIPTYSAATAFRYTSSYAGTFPYDEMDRLVISQVRTVGGGSTGYGVGSRGPAGGLYTTQTQTGLGNNGYGTIATGTKSTDTDGDGMPDFWEKTFGLNEASNDAMSKGSDGYVNIEKYINWLGDVHAHILQNKTLNFDMSVYTGGFAKVSPSYLVGSAVNGTVSLLGDGKTAQFIPKTGFSGMASFKFTVTGSDGTAFTFTVNILVEKDTTVVVKDCNGVINGTAVLDDCNICVGGNTGKTACVLDCNGVVNGSATVDACNVCVGGSTGLIACTGALQGEDFCVANGVLEAKNTGFQGDGYLNLDNVLGSSATWYLVSEKAQTVTVGVRFANGVAVARPMTISVNGTTQASITGNATGAWNSWKVELINLTLVKGPNEIKMIASTADGGPNVDEITFTTTTLAAGSCIADCNGTMGGTAYLDQCDICVGGTTAKLPCVKDCNGDKDGKAYIDNCGVCVGGNSKYKTCLDALEAEKTCVLDGTIDTNNVGYSGEGFVNTTNAVGAAVSWFINSDQNQTATLTFRYANGGIASRDAKITLNGVSADTLFLPTTEEWTSWGIATLNLSLKQGTNELKLTAITADGLANLDLIYLSAGLSDANCLITATDDVVTENLTVYPNPTESMLHWGIDQAWTLLNAQGLILSSGKSRTLDLAAYPAGMYLLKFEEHTVRVMKK